MRNNIALNELNNQSCHTKCNKEKRKTTTTDDLCNQTVSVIDGLPVRCVGEWAMEKIYHLVQYFGIFSSGMKNKWGGKINYIEICSGPGRCINRSLGNEFNGTSLCIIEHPAIKYLHKALFFDYNQTVVESLNKRIAEKGVENAKAIFGDYYKPKEICIEIKKEIKFNGLNLVFIDPTDCSLPFELIKELKNTLGNVDFIINIALGTDYNRNIKQAVLAPEAYAETLKKYSNFVGNTSIFRSEKILELVNRNDSSALRLLLRDEYINSLKKIGYHHFDFMHIRNYYDLIFASSHERGIEFWKEANKIQPDGQRSLLF
jgi:three-Cys-motif partner protein